MNIIFIGAQGSGKGTQAKIISEKLKIPHISTGDLLRNVKGNLKEQVDSYMHSGKLIPDELMLRVLEERLKQRDCKNGFILDGFPRNLSQANTLDKITKIDKVIEIFISDKQALKRLSGRWNCKKCGTTYNILTQPKPKEKGICDKCNLPLYQREDDKEEAIKARLKIYHRETEPVLKHYKSEKINGMQNIEKVTEDILKVLKFKS